MRLAHFSAAYPARRGGAVIPLRIVFTGVKARCLAFHGLGLVISHSFHNQGHICNRVLRTLYLSNHRISGPHSTSKRIEGGKKKALPLPSSLNPWGHHCTFYTCKTEGPSARFSRIRLAVRENSYDRGRGLDRLAWFLGCSWFSGMRAESRQPGRAEHCRPSYCRARLSIPSQPE
jgi:hypothetical protein